MVNYMELILAVLCIFLLIIIAFKIGLTTGRKAEAKDWKQNKIESIVKERIKLSRSILGGHFSEQLAPFLPGFKYNPNECRFIGKPIDILVFRGMDNGQIDRVVFVEIKSGKNRNLTKIERSLRDAVKEGRVDWQQYNVPEEITK